MRMNVNKLTLLPREDIDKGAQKLPWQIGRNTTKTTL